MGFLADTEVYYGGTTHGVDRRAADCTITSPPQPLPLLLNLYIPILFPRLLRPSTDNIYVIR